MYNQELVKEHKLKKLATAACFLVCITLVGGYMYYVNSPEGIKEEQLRQYEITNEDLNNIDKVELTEWEKESIANAMLERSEAEKKKIELAEAEPNVLQKSIAGINGIINDTKEERIQVWNNVTNSISQLRKSSSEKATEQKEGYDHLGLPYLKEGQNYTFSDNGMGAPNEAPTNKWGATVVNPNTGVKWVYNTRDPWNVSTQKEAQAEIDEMQNREVGKMGNYTKEQAEQFVKNMTINMGSMK